MVAAVVLCRLGNMPLRVGSVQSCSAPQSSAHGCNTHTAHGPDRVDRVRAVVFCTCCVMGLTRQSQRAPSLRPVLGLVCPHVHLPGCSPRRSRHCAESINKSVTVMTHAVCDRLRGSDGTSDKPEVYAAHYGQVVSASPARGYHPSSLTSRRASRFPDV
jgi:hypothetical protein